MRFARGSGSGFVPRSHMGSWLFGIGRSIVEPWARLSWVVILLAGCAGGPVYPVVSPPTVTTFRVPYEAVWNATVQSIGVVPPVFVDRTQGRIVTDKFSFSMPVQVAGGRGSGSVVTQVLTVSLDIRVLPTADGATAVHAQTTIHDALEYGFWPMAGGPNSPEGDLYARLASRLSSR